MKDKNFIASLASMIVLVSMFTLFGITFVNRAFNHADIARKDEVVTKYTELYEKIEDLDSDISSLEMTYEVNIYRMYERIADICADNPDTIRDAVMGNLIANANDPIKLEASILALLENYDEFKSDMEIQTYLNDNVNILESIERYKSVQDKYIQSLDKYNEMYLEEK